ncbi:MAG: L-rhamnose isomerase [Armatimonadota bacterium]
MSNQKRIEEAYEQARERYAEIGVDTDRAVDELSSASISLHCWQGDDVGGFEKPDASLSGGGIQVTGNYPGKARNISELRHDLKKAFSLIPGRHRLNLHAIYGQFGQKVPERDQIGPEHFSGWVEWAKTHGLKLDFNATLFSHPKADEGYTLSSRDTGIRKFWIEHVKRAREISAYMGKELGSPCIHNLWIPDGEKDVPVDRFSPRERLLESLDDIYSVKYPHTQVKDAVESKLFGIGSESFVVGSHEFYMGYAMKSGIMVCLDLGHFHPTESVADKISAVLQFSDEVLLHVSRGVRWDSDHVVILNDEVTAVMQEIVRCGALGRVHIALDYFDATLNRVGAWVTGARAAMKGLLLALLEPNIKLREYEDAGLNFERLAMLEELKTMPAGDIWNYFCLKSGVPAGMDWIEEVSAYGQEAASQRG